MTFPSRIATAIGLVIAGAQLGACTESRLHMSRDFGVAVRQDVAAQIADPDARYSGDPAPGSNGSRVGLAQKRYESNTVVEPASSATSTAITRGDNGSGGGGGSSEK